ncbi:NAD-dependent protein deacetylase SRT1, partial [Haematococcus lacustris]
GLCLVLGSSLQISPANEIPLNTRSKGGELVIVNLQKTPQDGSATMLVRGRVDPFLARVALALALNVLPFVRLDGVVLSHTFLSQAELDMAADTAQYCPLPQQQGGAAGVGEPQPDSSHPSVSAHGPFEVLVQVLSPGVT